MMCVYGTINNSQQRIQPLSQETWARKVFVTCHNALVRLVLKY